MEINYKNVLSIDTSGAALSGTWAVLGEGINDLTPTMNEVVETNAWLNAGGYSNSEVVGAQIKFSLTGKRVYNDAAQDFIFSAAVKYGLGQARKTQLKWEQFDPVTDEVVETVTVPATIVGIGLGGGSAQAGSAISIDIDCNGAPTTTLAYTAAQTLTCVSVEGTGSGKTSIYVNPVLGASNSYKYKITSVAPAIGDTLTTGWTAFTAGEDAIETGVTTGDNIYVAEVVTSTNVLVKAGTCTITTA